MIVDFHQNLIQLKQSFSDAISLLNNASLKILFVIDHKDQLIGTVTDGDIRRATIRGVNQSDPIYEAMNKDFIYFMDEPNSFFIENEMFTKDLVAIPILNRNGTINKVHALHDFSKPDKISNTAIVMAGGFGKRLGALTKETPKPLLKIGKKPIIQIIIENLKRFGFNKFLITLHYFPEKFIDFLGDGSNFGIEIDYIIEESPLGTAGCISLIKKKNISGSNLIINSDVLTEINYSELITNHLNSKSAITICTREYHHEIPFGIINTYEGSVKNIDEKPLIKSDISAGVYMINFEELYSIPDNTYVDMPELINKMIALNKKVSVYKIQDYWIDIGRIKDYERAQLDFNNHV